MFEIKWLGICSSKIGITESRVMQIFAF